MSLSVGITVAAEPPQRLRFQTSEDFRAWLQASRLTISEFRQLPIYHAHAEQFDPLIERLLAQEDVPGAGLPTLQDALWPHPTGDDAASAGTSRPGSASSAAPSAEP